MEKNRGDRSEPKILQILCKNGILGVGQKVLCPPPPPPADDGIGAALFYFFTIFNFIVKTNFSSLRSPSCFLLFCFILYHFYTKFVKFSARSARLCSFPPLKSYDYVIVYVSIVIAVFVVL